MFKKSLGVAIGIILLGLASSFAQAEGAYGGIKVGSHSFRDDGLNFSGTSLILYGGYEHNQYLSVEMAHMIHGSDTENFDDLWGDTWETKWEGSETILWVLPSLPINDQWSLYGKVGFGYYDYQFTTSRKEFDIGQTQMTVVDYDEKFKDSDTGTSFYRGAGIKWAAQNVVVRLEAIRQVNINTKVISLGITYSF